VVEVAGHRALEDRIEALQGDLDRLRGERDRARGALEDAGRLIAVYRTEQDRLQDILDDAGRRLALAVTARGEAEKRRTQKERPTRAAAGAVRSASAQVARRTSRAAARNTLALPAEVIPFAGVAVIVGVTSLDLYDACANIRDMNRIRDAVGLDQLHDTASATCAWTEKLVIYVPFYAPDCEAQVATLHEEGLPEDAEALADTCTEDG